MRLAVFGAAGRTGRQVTAQALERGHPVRALVRRPSPLEVGDDRVAVVVGDARNAAVVDERGPGKRIGAADFAAAALDALDRDEWIGHVVGVSSG